MSKVKSCWFAIAAAAISFPLVPNVLAQAPDYRFTRELRAGQTLAVSNIDGQVTVSRAAGRTAEVVVTKRVIRGNGDLVQALLEETGDGNKVCTVYLREAGERRDGCNDRNHEGRRREPLEVEMTYEVRVPDGVALSAGTVDGDIVASGLGAGARLSTVDGSIRVTGRAPERVSTVDGDVDLTLDGALPDDLRISTVDGSVRIAMPASSSFTVNATTVDGTMTSDFPLTVSGKWGPQSLRGTVGNGRSTIRITTVDGNVELRRR
jgi:hypothetical protein